MIFHLRLFPKSVNGAAELKIESLAEVYCPYKQTQYRQNQKPGKEGLYKTAKPNANIDKTIAIQQELTETDVQSSKVCQA